MVDAPSYGVGTDWRRFEPVLLRLMDVEGSETLSVYRDHGGYTALEKALAEFAPDELIELVKDSGLRGRGGAGFSAGLKWSFIPKDPSLPKYLVCNADESEPGAFKDRYFIERDPHQLLEGMLITSYAIAAELAYIYIRGEFVHGARVLERAIDEARQAGLIGKNILGSGFNCEVYVHRGAGAYICGEETGMLSSLEGMRGEPKLKPPFPAVKGLYGMPTVINNVETLACVPHIVQYGAEWFKSIGTEKSAGPKVFCLSGHVERPGLYEYPLGIPLRDLLEEVGGGVPHGRRLKGVIPGGSSTAVLPPNKLDTPLDFESVAEAGSMLGTASLIVMDKTVCMVKAAANLAHFYSHESCGQCSQCREGTTWM
ncbi:MAG: NADH-quinone oxidoreductase subunit NuoF, partial [bacterium]|nr:NADH-quinone oxidoreductase subunit NuoF [bacterium]